VTAKIKRLVIHHPSPAVFENLKRKLKNFYGFTDEQIQWVINEGNAPAATILIAMGRQLQDFSAGDLIMVNSFGAGGSFHCGFYEYLPKTTELVPSHFQTRVPDEKQTTDPLSLQ
jgi:3-oxoacyl-[acyl-carrier-protein] synthase III